MIDRGRNARKKLIYLGFLMGLLLILTSCTGEGKHTVDPEKMEHHPHEGSDAVTPIQEVVPSVFPPEEPTPTEEPKISQTEPIEVTGSPVSEQYVVVLDPGHGGKFTGAIYEEQEKNLNLKIATYTKNYLEEHYPQLTVYLTRDTDVAFDPELEKDLELRVQKGKDLGADVFVSYHLNASDGHKLSGAEVLCPHRENVKTESFLLANAILDELTELGLKRRGIQTRKSNNTVDANGNPVEYYAINRHAANRNMVGIIVEHCFMDNESDRAYINDEEALKRLGEADARGIASYFGCEAVQR